MRPARRARSALAGASAWLWLLAAGTDVGAEEPAAIEGRVAPGIEGISLSDVAPVVVYLDGVDGPIAAPAPAGPLAVHQRGARFRPRFLAIAVGQSVRMPNDDAIYHNVFSYSKPNDFDLGLYPSGESRTVTFRYPGVVKTYCSIHETMNGTIFVAPSPHFAVVSAAGHFRLPDVPPGRYRLVTWSERLPGSERRIRLAAGQTARLQVALGATAMGPLPAAAP